MARTHERSPSLELGDSTPSIKRLKSTHGASTPTPTAAPTNGIPAPAPTVTAGTNTSTVDPTTQFAPGVLDHTTIAKLNSAYVANEPFKYAIVEKLFQDELLQKVKDECLCELNFTEKQTDIYKVCPSPPLPLVRTPSP